MVMLLVSSRIRDEEQFEHGELSGLTETVDCRTNAVLARLAPGFELRL